VRSGAALTEENGQTRWIGTPPAGLPMSGDPLAALSETLRLLHTESLPGLPPLTGGMVGYLGYDIVRRLERIGTPGHEPADELHVPEMVMLLATDLAALDHHEGTVTLIANAVNWDATDERVDAAYDDAVARIEAMTATLAQPASVPAAVFERPAAVFSRRTGGEDYRQMVEVAKEHIRAGDAFQIVLSQRFDVPTTAEPLEVYRVLRATNPSPYMYLVQLPTPSGRPLAVVGSSPEALVTVRDGHVTMHPIAGTRPRGLSEEDDILLAKDLLADAKERSEHVMLVDLGRNDLGRVCSPGTVKVVDFFTIERYSHVMHIVSTVTGSLAPGRTAFDALTACFPAGTLSGAPKPRAMQIIDELESARRGIYGGVVGYLDFAGDADTAITIRTAVLLEGVAHVQAGAGIVADSVPGNEDAECQNKAAAVIGAVAAAGTLRPAGDRR
jgi:anthranilate synthase component 1